MLIAIEGLIGVGKSTLQKLLCEKYSGKPLIQEFENHPYLEKFYSDPERYAIEKIMIFLFMGYHQFTHLDKNEFLISDFAFEKTLVFGQVDLPPITYKELLLPSFNYLKHEIQKPDLLIYLTGNIDLVRSRIHKRGRKMEQGITSDYLSALDKAYFGAFENYKETPILRIDIGEFDFLHNKEDVNRLCGQIETIMPEVALIPRNKE